MNSKKEVQHVYLVGAKSLGAYGGYETFVYKLTEYHQNKENIKYHVACKANGDGCMDESKFDGVTKINDHEFEFHNAHCFKIDVPQIGPAQAIYYDVAALKACCEHIKKNHIPHPIVYIMACRIGPFASHFYREIHKLGGTVYLNPDGHEWMRAKWSAPIRKYWKISEQMMVKYCDLAICDSVNIEKYIHECYDGKGIQGSSPKTTFIAYGADLTLSKLADDDEKLMNWYFHIQTCDDGFDYTLYNKDFTERDGGVLETDGDKSVQEAMTELLAEFGCDAAEGKVMDAAELREQADAVAEQQAEVLKEKLAAERPAPEETLSFYVAECLEFTFAGEFHDHLTMEEALEAYDKIPSERMNADKCIGFCIEEDGGFVGMYELVVNDKVQRENINSINYFRDDKLVQQAISDMEKLMSARQQSKEQERGSTKKSVLDALRSLKAKKQEQPAQEQDKPKKAKKKGMEL